MTNLITQSQYTAQKPSTFSDDQRELVAWFFMRLKNVYGSKFDYQWADEKSLSLAKREFAANICKYDKPELDKKIELLKNLIVLNEEYEWPVIPKILAITTGRAPSQINAKAYEISDAPRITRQRNQNEGRAGLSKLRAILDES